MSVFCLGSEQIDSLWPEFGHHIERLERETGLLASQIRDDLKVAKQQLWGFQTEVITGVAITNVYKTARGSVCEIYGACGTESAPGQIDAIYEAIEKWANDIGCTRMRVLGRKGWKRRLNGYRETGIILEKELVNGRQ